MLSIFVGILVAATLVAGAPVYMRALERLAVNTAIDRTPATTLNLHIFAPNISLNRQGVTATQERMEAAIAENIPEIYLGQRRFLRSDNFLAGLPYSPLNREARSTFASQAYVQYMSELEDNIRFIDGRMATDTIITGPDRTVIEVILGAPSLLVFFLEVGDEVEITPFLAHPGRVYAKVVGIFEPIDPVSEYWRNNSNIFLRPEPVTAVPETGVLVNPDERPLPFFTTQTVLVDGVGSSFSGSLINSTWSIRIDKEKLKAWSISETRDRLDTFDVEITDALPGSIVLSGIGNLFGDYEQRSLFSSIPLLLLLALMVVTVLYYLLMMVSYLVQNREADITRLKTRGINSWQVFRIYGAESFILTAVAVVIAPLLATLLVSVSGYLPYFTDITGGGRLPARIEMSSFTISLILGLVCLVIYILPGVISARSGLITHRLRSSRPPTTPVFQRYYLDVALIILGGLVFWELYSRGNLASGGLFTGVQVNETLLLAPILFLAAVALVFMRFFPLLVEYFGGESMRLLNLVVVAVVVILSVGFGIREFLDESSFGWTGSAVIALGLGGAYYLTQRVKGKNFRVAGLLAQAGLVAAYIYLEPLQRDDMFFSVKIAAIAIVPAQLLFMSLRTFMSRAPVWVSVGMWQMARNPLQYSWLILLLVLVTGLGVLATTVGGTLDRSHVDRISYQTGTDIRVANIPGDIARGTVALKERYQTIPGVTSLMLGMRTTGSIGGGGGGGSQFELLGVEADTFPYKSWYREDFSERTLPVIMRSIQSAPGTDIVTLPDDATEIGMYVKPSQQLPNVFLWVALEDRLGSVSTLTLGPIGADQWHLMRRNIPDTLERPIRLLSVQMYEPAFGPTGTAGTLLIDDIHTVVDGNVVPLDDFESGSRWIPIITSVISSDSIQLQSSDVFSGNRSGIFTFGKDTANGIRGLYYSSTGGPIPAIVSTSFTERTGAKVGDVVVVRLMGGLMPIRITDALEYFPTLNPRNSPFVVVDMETMLRQLRLLSPTSKPSPNEMFLSHAPGAEDTVVTALLDGLGRVQPIRLFVRESELEAIRIDPLITAGWKAMVILALFVIVLTAGLGYITYLLSFSGRSRIQMGALQTLGISSRQLLGLLSIEHLVIAGFGLGLGTWAGFEMSRIMIQSVAVTESGAQVIPPFILMTNWSFLGPIYIVLTAIFLTAVAVLHHGVTHINLHTVSRAEAV